MYKVYSVSSHHNWRAEKRFIHAVPYLSLPNKAEKALRHIRGEPAGLYDVHGALPCNSYLIKDIKIFKYTVCQSDLARSIQIHMFLDVPISHQFARGTRIYPCFLSA